MGARFECKQKVKPQGKKFIIIILLLVGEHVHEYTHFDHKLSKWMRNSLSRWFIYPKY